MSQIVIVLLVVILMSVQISWDGISESEEYVPVL
jgi:hypothetical protein